MTTFAIGETDFELDGRPHRVLSGSIHYFRVHPDQWAQRISMAKAMGLNTIETYVPWNQHAPQRGEFRTDGILDLGRFLDAVAAAGLHAIVRPGPYICAEFDGGGLPGWLFRDPTVGVRRNEPQYLAAVEEYLDAVYAIVEPRQIDRGGPVVLVQIENEYGAYGSDSDYLRTLVRMTRDAGITVPLTTIDQPSDLAKGSLPGELHMTASFGSRAQERLATLREHQRTGPLMCAEFWNGWFDWWGSHHHLTSAADAAAELDALLAAGASVNMYMFHGGTSFGTTNGANDKGVYLPTVTSYDYDAPLDESGRPTEKFWAFREVIARYAPVPDEVPEVPAPGAPIDAPFTSSAPLFTLVDALGDERAVNGLPTTDSVDHYSGLALYSADIDVRDGDPVLAFAEVRDRAQLFLDGRPLGVLSREHHDTAISLPIGARGALDVLVEDQGRVNYGRRIGEHKGLIGPATLSGEALERWTIRPLDLDAVPTLVDRLAESVTTAGPVVLHARVEGLEAGRDLFLDTHGWGKGFAWINGFPLGRYWSRGPQHTLYVPGPLLRDGVAEVVVLELGAMARPVVSFVDAPDLGHTEL
jgi:beta-galactosidase